jgi:hypothetical protein
MHRSIAYIAVAVLLAAVALAAFPIWSQGSEQFDAEQELGILLVPFGLVTLLIAGTTPDPTRTTIGGAFGNPEYDRRPRWRRARESPRPRVPPNYREAVQCLHCGTLIAPELAQCLRCARARACRTCGRPLGLVLERPTCPACARPEPFCNCPVLPRHGRGTGTAH